LYSNTCEFVCTLVNYYARNANKNAFQVRRKNYSGEFRRLFLARKL